jgi:hypothetical protein
MNKNRYKDGICDKCFHFITRDYGTYSEIQDEICHKLDITFNEWSRDNPITKYITPYKQQCEHYKSGKLATILLITIIVGIVIMTALILN